MTNTAYKVWEAFKAELIVEPTDDMKQALVTALRELVNQCAYNHFLIDGDHGCEVVK